MEYPSDFARRQDKGSGTSPADYAKKYNDKEKEDDSVYNAYKNYKPTEPSTPSPNLQNTIDKVVTSAVPASSPVKKESFWGKFNAFNEEFMERAVDTLYGSQLSNKSKRETQDQYAEFRKEKTETGELQRFNIVDKLKEIGSDPQMLVPYVNGLNHAGEYVEIYNSLEKLDSGGVMTEKELMNLSNFIDHIEADKSFGYKALDIIAGSIPFAVQLATTGGIYGATAKMTQKTVLTQLERALGKGAKTKIKQRLVGLTAKSAGVLAGSAAVLPLAAPTDIAASTIANITKDFQLVEDDDYNIVSALITGEGDSAGIGITKAILSNYVEVASERTGGAFTGMTDKGKSILLRSSFIKAFLDKVPKPKQGEALAAIQAYVKKAGWNGVIPEMFEERVGEVAHGALFIAGLGDQQYELPTGEQLLVELVAFSATAGAINTVQYAFSGTKTKATTPEEMLEEGIREEIAKGVPANDIADTITAETDMNLIDALTAVTTTQSKISKEDITVDVAEPEVVTEEQTEEADTAEALKAIQEALKEIKEQTTEEAVSEVDKVAEEFDKTTDHPIVEKEEVVTKEEVEEIVEEATKEEEPDVETSTEPEDVTQPEPIEETDDTLPTEVVPVGDTRTVSEQANDELVDAKLKEQGINPLTATAKQRAFASPTVDELFAKEEEIQAKNKEVKPKKKSVVKKTESGKYEVEIDKEKTDVENKKVIDDELADLEAQLAELGITEDELAAEEKKASNTQPTKKGDGTKSAPKELTDREKLIKDLLAKKKALQAASKTLEPKKTKITHFTKAENIAKILEQGFDASLPPLHGIGGRGDKAKTAKLGKDVLYFTTDTKRWNVATIYVGEGLGTIDNQIFNYETQETEIEKNALMKQELSAVEAEIKTNAKILEIDSLAKAKEILGVIDRDTVIENLLTKAKELNYDILNIKNTGDWVDPNADPTKTGFNRLTGNSGNNDYFIINKDAIDILKPDVDRTLTTNEQTDEKDKDTGSRTDDGELTEPIPVGTEQPIDTEGGDSKTGQVPGGKVGPTVDDGDIGNGPRVREPVVKKPKVITRTEENKRDVSLKTEKVYTEEELALWKTTNLKTGITEGGTIKDGYNVTPHGMQNDWYYQKGDIYTKLDELNGLEILDKVTKEQYEIQKAKLEMVLPTPEIISEITVSPNLKFVQNLQMDNGNSLRSNFLSWIQSFERRSGVFEGSNAREITNFVHNEALPRGGGSDFNAITKERRKRMAESLFKKYLQEELSEGDSLKVTDAYNRTYNTTYTPNYRNFPLFVKMPSVFGDFKNFSLRDVQKEGIARAVAEGEAIIAHDVGIGKTIQNIVIALELMERGQTKRPLLVVPKHGHVTTLIADIKKISPEAKVLNLSNLGRDASKLTSKVADGTITVMTREGLTGLNFSEETWGTISKDNEYYREDLERAQEDRGIKQRRAQGKGTFVSDASFEDLGFDYISVDEIHFANHILSKVRMGDRASEFKAFSQTPSNLGINTFMAARYVQSQNDGRNVVGLSATPFTNHPLEYYSILSLLGRKEMKRMKIEEPNEFFGTFMKTGQASEFNAQGAYIPKTDVRGFMNNRQFKRLLGTYIDFKTGEQDGIIRPKRIDEPVLIPRNERTKLKEEEARKYFDEPGGTLKAIGALRLATLSPYLNVVEKDSGNVDLDPADFNNDYKELIENSPKLKTLVELLRQNKKDESKAGQIVYAEYGISVFPYIKQYLVNELGYKADEVVIIAGAKGGGISAGKRDQAQADFNSGKIKVLIGSETISTGFDLQKRTSDMFLLTLPWNFTQLRQIWGRAWRQGNMWRNVRINNLYIENSIDVFSSQKLENKQARIEAQQSSDAQEVETGNISMADIKKSIATDPEIIASIQETENSSVLQQKINRAKSEMDFAKAKSTAYFAEVQNIKEKKERLERLTKEAEEEKAKGEKPDTYWLDRIPEELANAEERLAVIVQKLEEKGLVVSELEEIVNKAIPVIEALEQEMEDFKGSREERKADIIANLPPVRDFTPEILEEMVAKRAEQNKTFYKLASEKDVKTTVSVVTEGGKETVVRTTNKPKKTRTVTEKKPTKPKKKGADARTMEIISDKNLTPEQKLQKILQVKQEGADVKDQGEFIATSRKAKAGIKTILEFGNQDLKDELANTLGIDVLVDNLDKTKILEKIPKPDAETMKTAKIPAVVAGWKLNVWNAIAKKPVLSKKRKRRGYTNETIIVPKAVQKQFIEDYPTLLQDFAKEIVAVKNFDDMFAMTKKYTKGYDGVFSKKYAKPDDEQTESYWSRDSNEIPLNVLGTTIKKQMVNNVENKYGRMKQMEEAAEGDDTIYTIDRGEDGTNYGYYISNRWGLDAVYYDNDRFSTYEVALAHRDKTLADENSNPDGKTPLMLSEELREEVSSIREDLYDDYSMWIKDKKGGGNTDIDRTHGNFKEIEEYDVKDERFTKEERNEKRLVTVYGFKGIGYGQYMKGSPEALSHTIQAMAAVEDMSMILKIDLPKAINKNNLSIGFGLSGGGGGALAHYNPNDTSINLTKKKGDGSLGHEFMHFMDDHLGTHGLRKKWSDGVNKTTYYTSKPQDKATYDLTKALLYGVDVDIAKTYKPQSELDETYTSEIIIQQNEGVTFEEIVQKHKDNYGSQSYRLGKYLQAIADVYRKDVETTVKEKSDKYFQESLKVGGGNRNSYWVNRPELWARAFQAYMEDKMTETGIQNSYITRKIGETGPYPQGAERLEYNKMFDAVFTEVRKDYPMGDKLDTTERFAQEDGTPPAMQRTSSELVAQSFDPENIAPATLKGQLALFEEIKRQKKLNINLELVSDIFTGEFEGGENVSAYGAYYKDNIWMSKTDVRGDTILHEVSHQALTRPEFYAGMTKKMVDDVMRAENGGREVLAKDVPEIQDRVIDKTMAYIANNKMTKATGAHIRFFNAVKVILNNIGRAFTGNKASIKDFAEALAWGRSYRFFNRNVSEATYDYSTIKTTYADGIEVLDFGRLGIHNNVSDAVAFKAFMKNPSFQRSKLMAQTELSDLKKRMNTIRVQITGIQGSQTFALDKKDKSMLQGLQKTLKTLEKRESQLRESPSFQRTDPLNLSKDQQTLWSRVEALAVDYSKGLIEKETMENKISALWTKIDKTLTNDQRAKVFGPEEHTELRKTYLDEEPSFQVKTFVNKMKKGVEPYTIPKETKRRRVERFVAEINNRIFVAQENLERQGATVNEDTDVFMAKTQLKRKTGHTMNKFQDWKKKDFIPNLVADGITPEELSMFATAKHVPHRDVMNKARGYKGENSTGMTIKESETILEGYEKAGKTALLEKHRAVLWGIQMNTLANDVNKGLRTAEEVAKLISMFGPDYVPMQRSFLEEEETGMRTTGTGKGIDIRGKETKRAFGSARENLDSVSQIFSAYEKSLIRGEKNQVGQTLLKFIQSNNLNEQMSGLFNVEKQQYIPRFDSDGELVYMDPKFMMAQNVIGVKKDGTQYFITIKDKALAESIKDTNVWGSIPYLRGFINYLSQMTTALSLPFVLRNGQRDLFEAIINVQEIKETQLSTKDKKGLTRKVVFDTPKLWRDLYRYKSSTSNTPVGAEHRELFDRFEKAGGEVGYFWTQDIASAVESLDVLYAKEKGGGRYEVTNRAESAIEWIRSINEAVELGVRVSLFKHLTKRGISDKKAALIAGDITIDFNRQGEFGPFMKSLFMFINPSIQGPHRMARAIKNSKSVRKAALAMVAGGFLNGVLSMMFGGDDDDNIAEYKKNSRIIFATPNGKEVTVFFLPWGYNFFWATGRNMAELAFGKRSVLETTKDSFTAFLDSYNPLGGSRWSLTNLYPTILKPFAEIENNENWFGSPIMPEQPPYAPALPDSARYWDSVSGFSKGITGILNSLSGGTDKVSGAIDVSPETIDHLIGSYTSSVGRDVMSLFDMSVKALTGKGSEIETGDMPIVRDYYASINGKQAKQQVVYPMIEDSERVIFGDLETQRFNDSLDYLVNNDFMLEDYAEDLREKFEENQHEARTGETMEMTSIRNAFDNDGDVDDVISELLGEDPTSASETAIRKTYGVYETFGFGNDIVNELLVTSSNKAKLNILLDYREAEGEQVFNELVDLGREKVRTASGKRTEILISDALYDLIKDNL